MIWLIGDKGLLGSELARSLASKDIAFIGTDIDIDITSMPLIQKFFNAYDISWVINCAAYTAVDSAEYHEAQASSINTQGAENIARVCASKLVRMIHISTDYVFAGGGNLPYDEMDSVSPINVYGRTKAEGERSVMAMSPNAIILRTSWLYGQFGKNFVSKMITQMKTGCEICVVCDQTGTPTWTVDLASAILQIISASNFPQGCYHFASAGQTTWFDFAAEIHSLLIRYEIIKRPCQLRKLITTQIPGTAKRPRYSVLNTSKIRRLGIDTPDWEKSLELYISTLAVSLE